jgi:stage V sporulation protein G
MQITDVRIRKLIENEGRLRAIASIVVGGDLAIHDLKVVQGVDRLFVAMPSRRIDGGEKAGEFTDICHPISKGARVLLENTVLAAYEVAVEEQCRAGQECEDVSGEMIDSDEMGGGHSEGLSLDAELLHTPNADETNYNPTNEV